MRLTRNIGKTNEYIEDKFLKEKTEVLYHHTIPSGNCYFIIGKLLNKLGQLEDIEDELGIDLIIFMRCLKLLDEDKFTYCYYLTKKKDFISTALTPVQFCIDLANKEFIELRRPKGYEQHLKFQDYGKTWALTEKELKK